LYYPKDYNDETNLTASAIFIVYKIFLKKQELFKKIITENIISGKKFLLLNSFPFISGAILL